jgi:membrane protease YdiL (CAAX protease family)
MIGILIILLISWIALYLIEKKSLHVLGILPVIKRLKQFVIGFIVTAILCTVVQYFELVLKSSSWRLNENFTAEIITNYFWWDFKSVLTEELMYRGALLYLLIKKLGAKKGILISAIAFGIYHWFSFGVLGQIVPMIVVFVGTGLMGYAWALAFSKTSSIAMPTGLHLGWNFTFNTIFSKGPLGEGILISSGGENISDGFSLIGLWIVPLIVLFFVKYLVPIDGNDLKPEEIKTNTNIA